MAVPAFRLCGMDLYNYRIQKFAGDGTFLVKQGSCGSGNEQFGWPCLVAIDSLRNVYVSDAGNNRIQKFGQLSWGELMSSRGAGGSVPGSSGIPINLCQS